MGETTGGMRDDQDQRDPEEIRRDIERTRAELGETVEAIQDRLSPQRVTERAKERVRARAASTAGKVQHRAIRAADDVQRKASQVREATMHWTDRITRDPEGATREVRDRVTRTAEQLRHDRRLWESVARGAVGGLGASAAMLPMMLMMKRTGGMRETVPKRAEKGRAWRAGARRAAREPYSSAIAYPGHFLYGAGFGALYGLLRYRFRFSTFPSAQLFGLGVYVLSFLGWLPALGIARPPWKQRQPLGLMRIMAHVLYGTVLGLLYHRSEARVRDLMEQARGAERPKYEPQALPEQPVRPAA